MLQFTVECGYGHTQADAVTCYGMCMQCSHHAVNVIRSRQRFHCGAGVCVLLLTVVWENAK